MHIALLLQPSVRTDPVGTAQHDLFKFPPASLDARPYVAIYALVGQSDLFRIGASSKCRTGLGSLAIFMLTTLASFRGSFKAARALFKRIIATVTNATFRYFDTTPTGYGHSLANP